MIWWIIGIVASLLIIIFLWLFIAGADESKRHNYKSEDSKGNEENTNGV